MKYFYPIVILFITWCSQLVHAEVADIKGLRIWPEPASTRVVFDLSKPVKYKVFTLTAPNRVVVDLENVKLTAKIHSLSLANSKITKIRSGNHGNHKLRLVFETAQKLQPKAFIIAPNQHYGHRLVINLELPEQQAILNLFDLDQINDVAATKSALRKNAAPNSVTKPKSHLFLVAIDAGHGGEDPGAIGKYGTREKDVVLRIAKQLKQLIDREPGMRAFLIRDGDYYIELRQRLMRARRQKADLFISIHADAFHKSNTNGSSVFVLSRHGASSEAAKWLANAENRSDLIGGVSLDDKSDTLASVLLDLSQAANERESLSAASAVLKSMGRFTPLHKPYVERAGFAVLKAPDVPSILVETGFISNPATEKRLRDPEYNKKLAKNIMEGLRKYVASRRLTSG